MFDSFDAQLIDIDDGQIFCLTGGNGPPLLLLHGYPETHVMWHKIAAPLAQDFRLIIPDLRGYGDSMIVPGDTDHYNYSKRRMAQDMAEIMTVLGHDKFMVAGHDRGGRVAHRLARDHRDRVQALSVLDICPTLDMYESTDMDFATAYFHWFFLIQPYDLPEKMIMSNPDQWMENCLQKWSGGFDFGDAVLEYQKISAVLNGFTPLVKITVPLRQLTLTMIAWIEVRSWISLYKCFGAKEVLLAVNSNPFRSGKITQTKRLSVMPCQQVILFQKKILKAHVLL